MKKLKLNLANMPGVQVLSREQLKTIMGGDVGSGNTGSGGTCCWHSESWDASGCGISKDRAIEIATQYAIETGNRGMWCCDNCW